MNGWSWQYEGLLVALALLIAQPAVHGDVLEFHDKDAWIAAVGEFTTIDFTGFPLGTPITDQYADLGALFTSGADFILCCDFGTFPNDGAGLDGNDGIELMFDSPQAWIATDHPGQLAFALFRNGELFFTSGLFGSGGVGFFGGLISSQLFDTAVIWDPINNSVDLDDLHFGVPACPADLDGDLTVAVPDLLTLLAAWGTNPGGPPDFDGDGSVDVPDLLALLANWGP